MSTLINNLVELFKKYGYYLLLTFLAIEFFALIVVQDGFHDFKTFIDAYSLLKIGVNPYSNEFFLNSFTLAVPLNLFAKLLPVPLGPTIWNLLNVFGIFISSKILFSVKFQKVGFFRLLVVVSLIISTLPARAMFASVQHTGIILGLLSISYYLLSINNSKLRMRNEIVASVLILIAFEFKPQFALGYLFALLFSEKHRFVPLIALILGSVLHFIVSLQFRLPLDSMWIERVLNRSMVTTSQVSGDNSPWVLLSQWIGFQNEIVFISFLVYFISIGLNIFLNLNSPNRLFIGAMLTPLCLSYLHTYDLLIIAILSIYYFMLKKRNYWFQVPLALLFFPSTSDTKYSVFVVAILVSGSSIYNYLERSNNNAQSWWHIVLVQFFLFFISIFFMQTIDDLNIRVCSHLFLILVAFCVCVTNNYLGSKKFIG